MEKVFKTVIFLMIVFIMICSPSNGWSNQGLKIVASIFPLQEFARAVGGERVRVDLLLPPGTEPHTWEPRPSDIVNISKSSIFIYIGAGMEPWVKDLLRGAKTGSLLVIEASEELDLIHTKVLSPLYPNGGQENKISTRLEDVFGHSHEGVDPHVWLDFQNDQKIIDKIVECFSRKDPDGREVYIHNGKRYKERLAELDRRYTEGLKNCRGAEIILGGHSAFFYMARRYGLKEVPLYGISPDAEPRPKEMARVIDFAKIKGVQAIFFERLVNDRMARVIAEEIGAVTLPLNSGSNLTKDEKKIGITFISIMEENLKNLIKGLGCE